MKITDVSLSVLNQATTGNRFSNKFEDYIDKSKKGYSTIGSEVPIELGQKLSSSSDYLAHNDPKQLYNYSAYLTGFGYDKRGRYVANLDEAFSLTNQVTQLYSKKV